jgi:hypothetical protein
MRLTVRLKDKGEVDSVKRNSFCISKSVLKQCDITQLHKHIVCRFMFTFVLIRTLSDYTKAAKDGNRS